MYEQATLIFSGQVLESSSIPLSALSDILNALEESARSRGVVFTRRIAALNQERLIASDFFLRAGFELVLADENEDAQATAIAMSIIYQKTPVEEIDFAFGMPNEPVNLLRSMGGKFRRVLISFDPNLRNASNSLQSCADSIINVPRLMAAGGVDWDALAPKKWSEWSNLFESAVNGSLGGWNAAAQNALDREPDLGAVEPLDESPEAQPGASLSDEREKNAAEGKTTDLDASASAADALTAVNEQETELELIDDFTADHARFAKDAPEWNRALEQILRENDLAFSADKALELLDRDFSGIYNYYLNCRDEFQKLLGANVKLITEAQGNKTFYHVEHDEMRPVSAANLTFSRAEDPAFKVPEEKDESESRWPTNNFTFEQLADGARLLAEQSRWMVERDELKRFGNFDVIRDHEEDFIERSRSQGVFIWHINGQAPTLNADEYLELAECYDLFASSLELMDDAMNCRDKLKDATFFDVIQNLANVQCLVKSALISHGVALTLDPIQQRAFEKVSDLRRSCCSRVDNLRMADRLELTELPKLKENNNALKTRYAQERREAKQRQRLESKLSFHIDKIKADPERSETYDWENVVACVSELCEKCDYKQSSVFFRTLLIDLIDHIPEELDLSDSFCEVVEAIDDYKELENERERRKSEECEVKKEASPTVEIVRNNLNGGKIVFIGGTPKDYLRKRIEDAFDVEMIWFHTGHGDSLDVFNPYLNDPEVKLFLAYIPWCSHKHSEELIKITKANGKNSVRLTRGTNPEQIAGKIVEQLQWSL